MPNCAVRQLPITNFQQPIFNKSEPSANLPEQSETDLEAEGYRLYRAREMTALAASPPTSPLASPVAALWGVGPERVEQLRRLEIRTIEELLCHRPRAYEDRRHFRPIAQLTAGEPAITRGKVVAMGVKW